MEVTGDLTVIFGENEDQTTPADTYRVFKIDMTSNNIKITLPHRPQPAPDPTHQPT